MSDLGDVIREHRGSPWRYTSGAVLSGLMAIGCAWAIFEMKPKEPGKAWLFVLLFAVIAVVFVFIAIRDASSRLVLHARGLSYERAGTSRTVRYADVVAANETR